MLHDALEIIDHSILIFDLSLQHIIDQELKRIQQILAIFDTLLLQVLNHRIAGMLYLNEVVLFGFPAAWTARTYLATPAASHFHSEASMIEWSGLGSWFIACSRPGRFPVIFGSPSRSWYLLWLDNWAVRGQFIWWERHRSAHARFLPNRRLGGWYLKSTFKRHHSNVVIFCEVILKHLSQFRVSERHVHIGVLFLIDHGSDTAVQRK